MKKLVCIIYIVLFSSAVAFSQVVTGRQVQTLLYHIVVGGNALLDNAQARIIDQLTTANNISIKTIECSTSEKKSIDTYVASYNDNGQLIDGMLVAQKGDVNRFRTDSDNEYVWFVGKGEASVKITSDSVIVSRSYSQEMKPLGDTYIRHVEDISFNYLIQADGSFIQLKPTIETYEIEGKLSTNADGTKTELPPSTKKAIAAEYSVLSMNVMSLLYAPISAHNKTMTEWTELGQFFKKRMQMMGIPDCDIWSANYYKTHIADILTQGDGRNMVWYYQHQNDAAASDMMSVLLMGYDSSVSSSIGIINDKLRKAANRLNAKAARKWWKDFTK